MADKPSGLKLPSKIAKATGIPKPSGIKPPSAGSVTSGTAAATGTSFAIGDRVLVSGTKTGTIKYLGPTQFAPGDWAGVALDKEEGKNDGSVAGVRYFQCDPLHGIFARPGKLAKLDENGSASRQGSSAGSRPGSVVGVKAVPLTAAALKAREGPRKVEPKSAIRSPASSIRSLRFGTPSRPTEPAKQDFEVGDRVIVNGVKTGYARYVGEADFAKGVWVGVELDSPQGKNDGSVMGKRYFTCEMMYGLFAPLHKVKKMVPSTPRTIVAKGLMKETAASAAKKKSALAAGSGIRSPVGSVASVSSTSSFTGMRTKKNLKSEVSSRYQRKTAPAGTSALQESLKEKQQHVESLMTERDLVQEELMQVTQDAAMTTKELDDINIKYQELVVEKENQVDALKNLVEQADLEKVTLRQQLEEQKAKVEDIQFRLEEEAINKDDLQSELTRSRDKARELEANLTIERNRSYTLQTDLEATRAYGVDDKSALDGLRGERDAANAQVTELRAKLTEFTEAANQAQAKSDAFEHRISGLMQELERMKMSSEENARSIESYKLKLEEVENEKSDLEARVTDLNSNEGKVLEERDGLQFTIKELKLISEERGKNLELAQKQISQLEADKVGLEKEKKDILQANGDSSSQLLALNDNIREKDKMINQLNADLRNVQATVAEMKITNETLLTSKSALELEVTSLKPELGEALKSREELKSRLVSAEESTSSVSLELEKTSAAHKNVLSELENLKREKEIVETRLRELMEKCKDLQETLRKSQQEWSESDEEKSKALLEAQSSLKELQDNMTEQATERGYLTKKNEAMQNKVIELSEQHDSLSKRYEEAKTTLSKLQEHSGEEAKNLLQQLQEQRETSEKQGAMVSESTRHMNEMLQQKIDLEEERDNLLASGKSTREALEKLQESLTDVNSEKDALNKQFEESRTENELMKAKQIQLQQNLEKAESDLSNNAATLKGLEASLAEKIQKCEELSSSLEEEKQSLSFFELALQNAESENKTCAKQLEETKEELNKKDEKAFSLLDEIQQLKDGRGKLEIELKMKSEECAERVKVNEQLLREKDELTKSWKELEEKLKNSDDLKEEEERKLIENDGKIQTLTAELTKTKADLEVSAKSGEEQTRVVKELETKFRNVETERNTLQQKLDSLSEQHGNTEQQSFQLLDKIQELEKVKGQLETDLAAGTANAAKTAEELTALKSENESVSQEKRDLLASLESAKNEQQTTLKKLEEGEKLLAGKATTVQNLNVEIEKAKQAEEARRKEVSELSTRSMNLESEVSSLKSKLEMTTSSSSENQQKISALLDQMKSLEEEKNKSESERKRLAEDLQKSSASLEQVEAKLVGVTQTEGEAEEKLKACEKKMAELEASLTSHQNSNTELSSQFEAQKTACHALEERWKSLEKEKADSLSEIESLKASLGSEISLREKLSAEHASLQAAQDQSEKAKTASESELQSSITNLTVKLESLKREKESAQKRIESLTDEAKEKGDALDSAKVATLSLNEELSSLRKEVESYKLSDEEAKSEIAALQKQRQDSDAAFGGKIASLEGSSVAKDEKIGEISAELSSLKEQHEQDELEKAEISKASLQKEEQFSAACHAFKIELESLKLSLQSTESDKARSQTQVAELSSEKQLASEALSELSQQKLDLEQKLERLCQAKQQEGGESAMLVRNLTDEVEALKVKFQSREMERDAEKENLEKQLNEANEANASQMQISQKQGAMEAIRRLANNGLSDAYPNFLKAGEQQQKLEEEILTLKRERDELSVRTEVLQNSSTKESSAKEEQLKSLLGEKSKLLEEKRDFELELKKLKQNVVESEEVDKEHRSRILILEADVANGKTQHQKLEEQYKSLTEIHGKLQAKLLKMEKSAPDVEERENVLKREFAKERASLQQTIDLTTALVEEARKQSDDYLSELSLLKSENVLISSLKESLKAVERERDNLTMELRSTKSSPVSQSACTEDSGVSGDDDLRGQVDFLNSVIVDQQAKIGDLNEKISELESMLLNGEDIDAEKLANEFEQETSDRQTRAAPRLFCDICDIFDAHDTDDCPTQSSAHFDTADLPPSTHNVAQRGEEREYCENCEVFGHWTANCTEDEMF